MPIFPKIGGYIVGSLCVAILLLSGFVLVVPNARRYIHIKTM
jgi:hypothetical protein